MGLSATDYQDDEITTIDKLNYTPQITECPNTVA